MVEIPDRLECLFSGSIDQHGDAYRIEIPRSELEEGTITSGETYRVAVLSSTPHRDDGEANNRLARRRIRLVPTDSHRQWNRATSAR